MGALDGFDTSFSPPDYKKAKAAGFNWVIRYVSRSPEKNVAGGGELAQIKASGIKLLGINWEDTARDAMRGKTGGVTDGKEAMRQAKAIGMPKGQVLWFSAGDFDAQPNQFATIDKYFEGVKEALGGYYLIGAYGGAGLLKHLKSKGVVKFFWQAGVPKGWYDNKSLWSGAHLWQTTVDENLWGGGVDRDKGNPALFSQVPQWVPGQTSTTPVTPPPTEEPTVGKVLTITQRLPVKFVDNSSLDTVGKLFRQYVEIVYNHKKMQANLKRLRISSNFRGTSGQDYHEKLDDTGAVDIAGFSGYTAQAKKDLRDLAKILYANPGAWLELIHTTPFNDDDGFYVKNGRKVSSNYYGAATNAAHLNHVHTAMKEAKIRKLIADTLRVWGYSKVVYKV